jgi:hypothetical protein
MPTWAMIGLKLYAIVTISNFLIVVAILLIRNAFKK